MSEDKKQYYKEWEQEHREERNIYRREKYRQKCKQQLECEIEKGIKPKQRKQRVTLKQQIAELKADLKAKDLLVDCYISVAGTLDNAKRIKVENEKLQQQLKDNTKQVCEKIRKFVDDYTKQHAGYYYDPDVNAQDLYDFLDQIEEGQ